MDLQPKPNDITLQLKQLEAKAQCNMHRHLVVFSGDEHWVKAMVVDQLPNLRQSHTLIVSDQHLGIEGADVEKTGLETTYIKAKQVKSYLGTEVGRLVWNGFSGLNPDGLGAASGLIKGGGLLFLMLPKFATLSIQADPDYLRMCSQTDELPNFGTRFLQRMICLINADSEVTVFRQNEYTENSRTAVCSENPISQPSTLKQLTQDQISMIDGILAVSKGHRKRPLVVHADRGRGKTSALGIAAARIVSETPCKIFITAPNRRACDAAFQHYDDEMASRGKNSALKLDFIAPDELIETLPECHLLFVDEAAAIPAPLLKLMLEAYPRVVFSSTTHGYEGTGQGFAVRFRHTLDSLTPQWKSLTLTQPVRWAEGDPLERWIFEFLLLNAQIPAISDLERLKLTTSQVEWISQTQLAKNNERLKQITALLVTAHYQTSPSDIRMILDHPKLNIGLVQAESMVVAVVLLLQEGGIHDAQFAQNIINGSRRPQGHLVPQALTSSTANPTFLEHQTYRIMRIAVHPSLSHQGLGSKLISAAAELGQKNQIDYLSASFGFTSLLINFWTKNHFQLLRIGYHKDAASGAQSAIVVRPLNNLIENDVNQAQTKFQQHFIFGLNTIYRTLDLETTLGTLHTFQPANTQQTKDERNIIKMYAHQYRSYEDSALILFTFILNCFSSGLIGKLSQQEQQLLCMRVLQGRSVASIIKQLKFTGKKQLEQTIKQATSALLDLP